MMVAVLWCLILALPVSAGYKGSSILRRSSNMYRTWGQFRCRASSPLYGRDPDGSPPPAPEPVPIQQGEERGREGERQQVLDREQAAVKSSFEARLNELRFGYESNETATGGWTIAAGSPRKPAIICGSALEYDKRGCGETMSTTLTRRTRSSTINTLRSLPCFQDDGESGGTCPYVRLRCSRGHEWKAVPGSEVSMKCPICSASKTASVAKRKGSPRKPKISIYNRVTAHATSKGGVCHLHPEDNHSLHWNSSVPFECVNGHKWTATVTNILKKESWCAQCLAEERLFLMQETAACFDGQFLGFVEDMSRHKKLLRYQFLEGTFGMAYEDFDSSTGMFRIRKGQAAAAPKWPSSDTVRTKTRKGATVSSTNGTSSIAETKTMKRKPLSFSQSPAYWECSQGHIFVQSSNNIRRKQGSARKCSWCPDCSKAGLKFAWFPTAKEKSFAIKKKKEAQRR